MDQKKCCTNQNCQCGDCKDCKCVVPKGKCCVCPCSCCDCVDKSCCDGSCCKIENGKVSIRAKCDFKYVNIVFYFKN